GVPGGEVQVAGATIALRSALPDEETVTGIRSDKPPHSRPPLLAALQSIGIALVIVSVAPALLAIAAVVRRVRAPRLRRSPRLVRREEHASLEAVRAMDVDTPERRRAVFGELDRLVRASARRLRRAGGERHVARRRISAGGGPDYSASGARYGAARN